ncbi:hypothetical protein NDU88_004947 [Pleurodeles waltl]|uniref:Uncharacterized protein n=1 Tax=Pleurodeles waltl TaxID=8319 RepID=A0AAV7V2I2_PLEWA|nr:hypothetical protein NDU88_004947 [Pleurodeles waltl]
MQGEDSVEPREISSGLLVQERGRLPPSMHHQETGEKGSMMKRYKVAVVVFATFCNFAGVLSSQRSIILQKVKREMQRNSGELLHSVSEEFPKAETLNSQKRRFGYLGRRIG